MDRQEVSSPSLFVGSSREGIEFARAIQVQLADDCEVELWNEGVFSLGYGTLESLGCLSQALISEAARWNSPREHSVDLFMGCAAEDLCDQGSFLVQFACHTQIIAAGNQAIFHVDGILSKDRVDRNAG